MGHPMWSITLRRVRAEFLGHELFPDQRVLGLLSYSTLLRYQPDYFRPILDGLRCGLVSEPCAEYSASNAPCWDN
jgi:hypothetical protein